MNNRERNIQIVELEEVSDNLVEYIEAEAED